MHRIAGGDDLSGAADIAFRTSARALQRRHLVDITRKGGIWRAQVTAAGSYWLEHGRHPDDPATPRKETKRRPAANRKQKGAAAELDEARRLIERLQSENGTIRLPNPSAADRASYRRLLHLCKKEGLVPDGSELLHTGRDQGDLIIRLSQGSPDDVTDWNRIRLNVRRTITDPQALIAAITEKPHCLKVTDSSLPRAIKLTSALAKAAIAAGYSIGINTKPQTPKLFFQAGRWQRDLTLEEEYDEVRHVTTAEDRQALRQRSWRPPPAYEKVASGRLRLQIDRGGSDKTFSWSDEKGARLERRLADILEEVRLGLAEDEQERLEANRRWAEQQAEWDRAKAEKRSQWHNALAAARVPALEDVRHRTFRRAYDQWTAAGQIRAFCAALEPAASDSGSSSHLPEWIDWARTAADELDPVTTPSGLGDIDFNRPPGPDELRPYLGDWSPHRPEKEYRSSPLGDRSRADTRGHPGHSSWWHPQMRDE